MSNLYKVQTRIDADILKMLEYQLEKKNMTVSEYVRDAVRKAVMQDVDVATTATLVDFNRSNNDKVTKVRKPVSYKKLNLKLGGKLCTR
jgi:uncharacterized protein with FMN-binding domain